MAGHPDLDAQILTRLETGDGLAVLGLQIERLDAAGLVANLANDKRPKAAPAAWFHCVVAVDAFLGLDEDAGQLGVGLRPGTEHGMVRIQAQMVLDGLQQIFSDDRIVLGRDLQAGVLVGDATDHGPQVLQLVDVRGVHEHRFGQGARLLALRLIGHVEDVLQFRMPGKQLGVEQVGDRLALLGEQRRGGFDGCQRFGR